MITIILVSVIFVIIFLSWIRLIWDSFTLKNIIGPFPIPLVGNAHMLFGDASEFMHTIFQLVGRYGDIFRMYLLSRRYIILNHPKYIEGIISSNVIINKGQSYRYFQPWLGQGLLTAAGQRWKSHRKFLTPAFHYGILQNFLPIFIKNNQILVDKLNKLADGRPVNIFPIIALVALDNITEAIMGVTVNAQLDSSSEYVKSVETISEIISKRMRHCVLMFDLPFNLSSYKTKQNKALNVLHGQSNKVIRKRREALKKMNVTNIEDVDSGLKNKYAFLDLLLLAEVDGQKIHDDHIREEVDTFMFEAERSVFKCKALLFDTYSEGHDTTTSGIVFCLYCISKHEYVQKKILDEAKTILGNDLKNGPTKNDLQSMKYLEMVIKESLRLYPSVPLIERHLTEDTEIAGTMVKKNSNIIINILHSQRQSSAYKEPLEFRPERFEANQNSPFDWLAFSAGPRNCIGQKFAMMEMKAVICSVIWNFELLPSGIEPNLTAELILRSENGVHVKFVPRKHQSS